MTYYQHMDARYACELSPKHEEMLFKESAIAPDVVAERGVRTVRTARDLPRSYSWRQKKRVPGILFTAHRPNGETATIFRPDAPDPKNPGHKYEQECKKLGGSGNVLDVLEHHRIGQMDTPVLFTEGVKKADSITSAARRESTDILAVGISGVWNWLSEGEPISDMYDIIVEGRSVYVCFDSDMLRKPEVMMAGERLAEYLISRGAKVWIVYLPDQADGTKTGADDFLAAGGTLEELLGLSRPFDPQDLQREKLSRDEQLRRYLVDLRRQHDELPAKTRGECSRRAAWRACLTVAERYGKPVEDGVLIERLSARTGAELALGAHDTHAPLMLDAGVIGARRAEEIPVEVGQPVVAALDALHQLAAAKPTATASTHAALGAGDGRGCGVFADLAGGRHVATGADPTGQVDQVNAGAGAARDGPERAPYVLDLA